MKAQLLALSVIATSMGFAQESQEPTMHTSSNGQCSSCCSTSCCCKPCCVPKPPKCIDCECYVPQHYDMSCDCGLFVSVDFLYFYGKESNLPYAAKSEAVGAIVDTNRFTSNLAFGTKELEYIDGKWDPGVRVGFGWKGECDGWDLSFFWTYYKNDAKSSTSGTPKAFGDSYVPGDVLLASPWLEGAPYGNYTYFSGKWDFKFNSFDLEFGRRYWLSKCFDLRPYFGLRGAWGETELKVSGSGLNITSGSQSDSYIKFDNNNWGVGFLGGIQPVWHFSDCFSFYSNFDMSLIWGRRKNETGCDISDIALDGSPVVAILFSSSSENYGMQTALDMGLGFRYENCYCDNQYRFSLDLGWEHHIWLNYNERFIEGGFGIVGGTANSIPVISAKDLNDHDVGFGGFVLRARFDF